MLKWSDIIQLATKGNLTPEAKVQKTDAQWKEHLSPEEYRVTRSKGTEKAFSSSMCVSYDPGIYSCICCNTQLFDSTRKFNSGTGWPSFNQPIKENAIAYFDDHGFGMHRIEAVCNTCDAHLGHVFPDGPEPSGLRYCINAVALIRTA